MNSPDCVMERLCRSLNIDKRQVAETYDGNRCAYVFDPQLSVTTLVIKDAIVQFYKRSMTVHEEAEGIDGYSLRIYGAKNYLLRVIQIVVYGNTVKVEIEIVPSGSSCLFEQVKFSR